ncbi:hypothetical protein QJQ45_004112 [Haematococcus lacustris]|nr:hypothetical protein QJQ45_004112 [Haematococcus lacustris]
MRAAAPPKDQRELLVKFKVIKFLGKGSYGSVYQVQRLSDGQLYALKEMDVRQMSQAEREDSANEVRLLASVVHPNVISYNEAFLDGNRLCIIMEYAPDGDLAKVIKKWQALRRPMPEDLIWRYFIQARRGRSTGRGAAEGAEARRRQSTLVVLGLAALHSMRILHRDIKPGNIMVMEGDVAKIGDLGIAKLLKHTLAAKTQIGTPHYMPPEIWKNRPYAFFSDTWALGCILYEMATFTVPFEARSMNELRHKVPEKRPSMERILSSPAVMARMHLLPGGTAPRTGPPSTAQSTLIDTIKVPRGNFAAIKSKLPPAQYASDTNQLVGDGPAGLPPRHGAFRPIPEDYSDVMSTPELYEDRRLPVLVPPHKAGGGFGPAGGPGQQPQQKPMPLPFAMGPPAGQRGWPSQAQQAQQVQQAQQLIKAMEAGRLPGLPLALQQVANRWEESLLME